MRHSGGFNTLLLVGTIGVLLAFLSIVMKSKRADANLIALAGSSFVAYGLQRGVHMQFFLWIYFFLPYLFIEVARLHLIVAVPAMLLLDWAHSWVSNCFRPVVLVEALSAGLRVSFGSAWTLLQRAFGQMQTVDPATVPNGTPVYQMLGKYYLEPFGWRNIPASFVLFVVLLLITWRMLVVLARENEETDAVRLKVE